MAGASVACCVSLHDDLDSKDEERMVFGRVYPFVPNIGCFISSLFKVVHHPVAIIYGITTNGLLLVSVPLGVVTVT